jgi:hypothetical protein
VWYKSINKPLLMLLIWNLEIQSPHYILSALIETHTDYVCTCLMSFMSVMYCNSEFGFLNSFNSAFFISTKVMYYHVCIMLCNFIYHTSAQPLNVVSNYTIVTASSCMFLAAQTISHTNKCCYGSSDPTPLNSRILRVLYTPTILACVVPPLSDASGLGF